MVFFVGGFKMGIGNMSVNLGSGDVGMAKKRLDRAEIGAIKE